jgi:hypothetical protein
MGEDLFLIKTFLANNFTVSIAFFMPTCKILPIYLQYHLYSKLCSFTLYIEC